MTRYAYFDHTQTAPQRVIGWYDTKLIYYPNMPNGSDLLEVTDDQWDDHFVNASGWQISESGSLETYTPPDPPPPTPAEQARSMMAAGIQITSASNPTLNGTYAVDQNTTQQVNSVLTSYNSGLGLPGGGDTFGWPDTSGMQHMFTIDEFRNLAGAMMNFNYTLNSIISGVDVPLPMLPVEIG